MPYTLTLIANPQQSQIIDKALEAVSDTIIQPCAPIWLAEGEACDINLGNVKDTASLYKTLSLQLEPYGIDVVIQPSKGRKKSILIADMDSTMIQQECIDELAAEIGIKDKVAHITACAMNGEIDFEPALKERVALLEGLSLEIADKVMQTRISYMPGGKTLLSTMHANSGYCALVSGGFTLFTQKVAEHLGFDENRANTLLHKDGKLTGTVQMPILGKQAKVNALNDVCAKNNKPLTDAIAVGDGANDLGMLDAAGTGVALHAKPAVAAEADIAINNGDLTALLYIQGYKKSEFVES